MQIIGITGNSGAGKSTVSWILANKKNAKILNADKISRKMQTQGEPYYQEIVETFGKEILDTDRRTKQKQIIRKNIPRQRSKAKARQPNKKICSRKNKTRNKARKRARHNYRCTITIRNRTRQKLWYNNRSTCKRRNQNRKNMRKRWNNKRTGKKETTKPKNRRLL